MPAESFGPAEKAEMAAPAPKPVVTRRAKVVVVDEIAERTIVVVNSSVSFRPGQILDSPHLIQLAQEFGIATRER